MTWTDWTPLQRLRPGDGVWEYRVRDLFQLRSLFYAVSLARRERIDALYDRGEEITRIDLEAMIRAYPLQARMLRETFDAWAREPGRPWPQR